MESPAPHIVIGTPCYGGNVTHLFTLSLLRLQQAASERGVELSYRLLRGDALITRARAIIAAEFLAESRATHLLFIDADIGFQPEQVFALLDADKDVAGAVYPLKYHPWDDIRAAILDGRPNVPASAFGYAVEFSDRTSIVVADGFARAQYVGNGFMMVRRAVFERMAVRYPELHFRQSHTAGNVDPAADGLHAFFDTMIDPHTGTYLSEDYAFCRRWTDMGGEIWVDINSKLTHIGAVDFAGDFMSILRP